MHAPRSHYALLNVCFRLGRGIMTTVNIPAEVNLYIFGIFLISDIRTWNKDKKKIHAMKFLPQKQTYVEKNLMKVLLCAIA